MTAIRFHQRTPDQGPAYRGSGDNVVITRGQRTVSPDGDVLLPGRIVVRLVDGTGVGNIEPTDPGECVILTYNHRESYERRVEIPDSTSTVNDTDLLDTPLN